MHAVFMLDMGDPIALYPMAAADDDMQLPFIDMVVMGMALSMLEPNAGVCGEHEFMEAMDTQDILFMEYVGVIGDMGMEDAGMVDGGSVA